MATEPNQKTNSTLTFTKDVSATTLTVLITVMVLSWVFNFIFGKLALRHFDPLTLAVFRVELAAHPAEFRPSRTLRSSGRAERYGLQSVDE